MPFVQQMYVGNQDLQENSMCKVSCDINKNERPSLKSVDSQDVKYLYPLSIFCNTEESNEETFS